MWGTFLCTHARQILHLHVDILLTLASGWQRVIQSVFLLHIALQVNQNRACSPGCIKLSHVVMPKRKPYDSKLCPALGPPDIYIRKSPVLCCILFVKSLSWYFLSSPDPIYFRVSTFVVSFLECLGINPLAQWSLPVFMCIVMLCFFLLQMFKLNIYLWLIRFQRNKMPISRWN